MPTIAPLCRPPLNPASSRTASRMLIASLAGGAAFVAPTLRAPPSRVARHPHPVARQLAFVAKAEKASPPFAESHDVAAWFAEESAIQVLIAPTSRRPRTHPPNRHAGRAIQVLMSQADGAERLDKGEVAGEQRWEVTTGIPFPGMPFPWGRVKDCTSARTVTMCLDHLIWCRLRPISPNPSPTPKPEP